MIFGELLIVFSRNVNLLYRIYLMLLRCCLLHLTNKIVENFSQNSTLEDLGISLLVFHATTTLNLHNILVTPTLVKIVITNLDLSKASSSDCVLVVVLKNCESEVSQILVELFLMKKSYFPYCWKALSVVSLFKNVWERTRAKSYHPVSLLYVVNKIFEKYKNNRLSDNLEQCSHFPDFQYGWRCSRSTADLLILISDRITRGFDRSGTTIAVALDISKAFDQVWHAGLLHKLKYCRISGLVEFQVIGHISSFLNKRRLCLVRNGKSLQ